MSLLSTIQEAALLYHRISFVKNRMARMNLSHQELLEAQDHIWNHTFNYINSLSLKCILQLGIPDVIHRHGKPMMLSELTQALSIIHEPKSHGLERLMSLMVHSKFFDKVKISDDQDEESYWLTPFSLVLLKDEPLSMAPFVHNVIDDPIFIDLWHSMSKWFVSDDSTPFVTTHGTIVWEHMQHDSRLNTLFNECMASDAQLVSRILTQDFKHVFDGLKSIVDVGGGTGTIAKALAGAFQGLKCSVLDLPHVVDRLGGSTDDDVTYIGGDMFEFIPPADCVFMKWILHDWSDEECIKILRKCKEAIPSKEEGGKIIIVDIVMDDKKGQKSLGTQLLFDMMMMSHTSGRERTEGEWADLFLAAEFTSYKISNKLGLRSLIEVFP